MSNNEINRQKPFHEEFAENIIAKLEAGTTPWQKPWKEGEQYGQHNPVSGAVYKGVNRLQLSMSKFSDPRWMTSNQATDSDYQIKQGSKPTTIVFYQYYKEIDKLDNDGKAIKEKVALERPVMRLSKVFNAEQIEGMPPLGIKENVQTWDIHQRAEKILQNSLATIKYDQPNKTFYRASSDEIHLPSKENLSEEEASKYYSKALHELGHWTGHESRLDRAFSVRGTLDYAKEELRAEIASWMLGDDIGIGHDPVQHTVYVDSWIQILKDEPLEIMRACRDAEKVKDFVMGFEKEIALENFEDIATWDKTVDDYIDNKIASDKPLQMLSQTPLVMELVGAKALPVEIKISTIKKVLNEHNLPIETLKQVPKALAEPVMIFESATNDNLVVMLDLKDKMNSTVIAPILLNKQRGHYNINEIISIYGRTKPLAMENANSIREPHNEWFIEQIEKGNLKYIDHKKSLDWVNQHGLLLPSEYLHRDKINIHSEADLVKLKEERSKKNDENEHSQEQAPQEVKIAQEKTFLSVPFEAKESAKKNGAKWDKENKLWFAPIGTDLTPLQKWLPEIQAEKIIVSQERLSAEQEFAQKLEGLGFELNGLPIMDGSIQRVPLQGRGAGNKDGAYSGYLDGIPAGWAENYSTGEKIKFISTGHVLSDEEKARQQAERVQKLQTRENERLHVQNEIGDQAFIEYEQGQEIASHPYLENKGIEPVDIRVNSKNQLLIPVRNTDEQTRGIQYINADGSKYFKTGMEKKGNFCMLNPHQNDPAQLGKEPAQILICEGYATACSLHEATGLHVAVAFDSGNLGIVAENLRHKNPNAELIICADNDHSKKINVGVEKAKEAVTKSCGTLKTPVFTLEERTQGLTDFNDLHKSQGIEAVKNQLGLEKTINKMKAPTKGLSL